MKDKKPLKEKKFFHSEIVIKVLLLIIGLILYIGFKMIDHFIFKKPISYGRKSLIGFGWDIPDSLLYLICIIFIFYFLRKLFNFLVKKIRKLFNYNETGEKKKIISFCINFTAVILILIILSLAAILLIIFFNEIILHLFKY